PLQLPATTGGSTLSLHDALPICAVVSLTQAAQWADAFKVRLALEFRGRNTFCASLDTALALIAECGQANVGVNFDVFHYYTGPRSEEHTSESSHVSISYAVFCLK